MSALTRRRASYAAMGTVVGLVVVLLVLPPPSQFVPTTPPAHHPLGEGTRAALSAAVSWVNVSAGASPGLRVGFAMAYDPVDGYVVLFGGVNFDSNPARFFNDTWTYLNGTWTNITSTAGTPPSPRAGAGMTYDVSDGYVVLFGGFDGNAPLNDLWEFQGGKWSSLPEQGELPASAGLTGISMTYDSTDGYVLVLYSTGESTSTGGTAMAYHAGDWTDLTYNASTNTTIPTPGFEELAIADAPFLGGVVVYGGTDVYGKSAYNSTWLYSGRAWTDVTSNLSGNPPGRSYSMATYDNATQGVVRFGGLTGGSPNGISNDTWVLQDHTWTNVTPPVGPVAAIGGGLVWDAKDGYALLYEGMPALSWALTGGSVPLYSASVTASPNPVDLGVPVDLAATVSGGTAPYHFGWTGLPAGCVPVDSPQLTCNPTLAGAFPLWVKVTDSANQSVNGSTTLVVAADPVVLNLTASPSTVSVGNQTRFTAVYAGGTSPYSFTYVGLPQGCASADASNLTCTPTASGTYRVTVVLLDAFGLSGNASTLLTVTGPTPPVTGPPPTIVAFVASPSNITLGASTTFLVAVTGGAGLLTFSFLGLPPGCSSANTYSLSCTPASSGEFSVVAVVTDSLGQSDVATAALTVEPAPPTPLVLVAFVVYPAQINLGNLTVFVTLASGGSGALTYAYTGLPGGCLPLSIAVLPCRPTAAGTYPVEVYVTDSLGATATSTTVLVVNGPPAPPTTSSAGGPSLLEMTEWVGLGVAAGVAATAVVALLLSRRRAPPAPPPIRLS